MSNTKNKGEWSELYAFARLVRDGRIYTADENANRRGGEFLPILKVIREGRDFVPGGSVRVFVDGTPVGEFTNDYFESSAKEIFQAIVQGGSGAFQIPAAAAFMSTVGLSKVKAPSSDKSDLSMQIRDFHTGLEPKLGFSIKSDVGYPPTLLNPGKTTAIAYEVSGLSQADVSAINAIRAAQRPDYVKGRVDAIYAKGGSISFSCLKNQQFSDNLSLIDGKMPLIWGEMVLLSFARRVSSCKELTDLLVTSNPAGFGPNREIAYPYKLKKMLSAIALGMVPSKPWDGHDEATGGYIIVKKDGDVVCYHLYNRDFFESYLFANTRLDNPSSSRYDYGYLYQDGEKTMFDLNSQIRFK